MKKNKFGLMVRYPDQSPSFTYGVEYGRLLQKMEQGDASVFNNGFPVREENKDLLIASCKAYGYIPNFCRQYKGGWIEFFAMKITPPADN